MLPLAERQGGGEPGRAVYLRDLCARSQANHLRVQTSQTSLSFGLKSDVSRSSQVALQSCGAPLRTQPGAAFIYFFFLESTRCFSEKINHGANVTSFFVILLNLSCAGDMFIYFYLSFKSRSQDVEQKC